MKNQNISIWGQWKFSIPIQVNKEDVTMYEVNGWNEGYSIDEVIVTPIITTIKTTHPDIYRDNFNYDVLVYGDENGTEELTMQDSMMKRKVSLRFQPKILQQICIFMS